MFRSQHISVTGFQLVDTDSTVEQKDRAGAIPQFATVAGEKNPGYGNWQMLRPGDPANMMFWALNPNVPPTRGAASGSYSYAFPARKVPIAPPAPTPPTGPVTGPGGGAALIAPPVPPPTRFLPLNLPDLPDIDYEPLSLEEAGPEDWIILATTKHGDRRKLAFRPPHPIGFRLCADHRSDVAPDLSSIVHDGMPIKTLDEIRKAGLHTTWEVREYNAPGGQPNPYGPPSQTSSQPYWKKGDVAEKFAISWVGDSAPDSTGYCNIGFGDKTALHSHRVSGPFAPSFKEKHWLADTNDGPIISGATDTKSYFVGTQMPFTAPLEFEEKFYGNPADSTYEYKVFLWYDKKQKHDHFTGKKEGLWRWFTRVPIGETPKCSPTKDYSTSDVNDNPRRTFAENSRAITHKKLVAPGMYMAPRPNLVRGRIPGTATKFI